MNTREEWSEHVDDCSLISSLSLLRPFGWRIQDPALRIDPISWKACSVSFSSIIVERLEDIASWSSRTVVSNFQKLETRVTRELDMNASLTVPSIHEMVPGIQKQTVRFRRQYLTTLPRLP